MNFNKKALESYITILLVVSLILTILITTLFSSLFVNDPEDCQYINYEIKSKKKMNGGAQIKIENKGDKKINFQFNGKNNLKDTLLGGKTLEYQVNSQDPKITIIPLFIDPINPNAGPKECRGKKKIIDTSILN